jgi:hypothetical protein
MPSQVLAEKLPKRAQLRAYQRAASSSGAAARASWRSRPGRPGQVEEALGEADRREQRAEGEPGRGAPAGEEAMERQARGGERGGQGVGIEEVVLVEDAGRREDEEEGQAEAPGAARAEPGEQQEQRESQSEPKGEKGDLERRPLPGRGELQYHPQEEVEQRRLRVEVPEALGQARAQQLGVEELPVEGEGLGVEPDARLPVEQAREDEGDEEQGDLAPARPAPGGRLGLAIQNRRGAIFPWDCAPRPALLGGRRLGKGGGQEGGGCAHRRGPRGNH